MIAAAPPPPDRNNCCAVMVTHQPPEDVSQALASILPHFRQCLIIDNTPGGVPWCATLPEGPISIHRSGKNLGMGWALNTGMALAMRLGFAWVMLFDQDSVLLENPLPAFAGILANYPATASMGPLGCNYVQSVNGTDFLEFSRQHAGETYREVSSVITSGCLLSRQAYTAIGPFRDDLFIDQIDHEYCFRARSRGHRVLLCLTPLLRHAIGTPQARRLPWKTLRLSNHPAWRKYAFNRNLVVIARQYFRQEPSWFLRMFLRKVPAAFVWTILFEENKKAKLRALTLGLLDGLFGRLDRNIAHLAVEHAKPSYPNLSPTREVMREQTSHTPSVSMTQHLHPENVAVIILHYKNWSDTILCLESLLRLKAMPRRIMVVDNGSGDNSTAQLRSWAKGMLTWQTAAGSSPDPPPCIRFLLAAPGCRPAPFVPATGRPPSVPGQFTLELLELPANIGFGAGNNAALRVLLQDHGCRAFWLLNNDTLVEPGALDGLLRRAAEKDSPGCIGSTICFQQPRRMVQCLAGGRFNRFLGTTSFLGQGLFLDGVQPARRHCVEQHLDYIVPASLFVTRDCLEAVGLFPEIYFLYYEDVDWGVRARQAGFAPAWAPGSVVHHREGGAGNASSRTVNRRNAQLDYLIIRNRVAVVRRHSPWALPTTLLTLPLIIARRVHRGQGARAGMILKATWAGLVGDPNFDHPR